VPKNYEPPKDIGPVCYCQRLRKLKRKCQSIHLPPRLLNDNGWLACCNHPGCKEILYVVDRMKTISHDYKFSLNS